MYPDSKPASDGMPRRCDKSEGLICKHQVGSCRVHLRTEDGISGLINAGDHTNLVHAAEEVGSSMLVIALTWCMPSAFGRSGLIHAGDRTSRARSSNCV